MASPGLGQDTWPLSQDTFLDMDDGRSGDSEAFKFSTL